MKLQWDPSTTRSVRKVCGCKIAYQRDRLPHLIRNLYVNIWEGRSPKNEKAVLHYTMLRHLSTFTGLMEEMIKINSGHLYFYLGP